MSFDEWFGKNIDYLPYGEAIKLLCKSAWEHQQQRIALKDREIMQLREALRRALEDLVPYHTKASTYKSVNEALSTPATYEDLMAWHEAQLGEPKAWIWETHNSHDLRRSPPPSSRADLWQPLYAKKG